MSNSFFSEDFKSRFRRGDNPFNVDEVGIPQGISSPLFPPSSLQEFVLDHHIGVIGIGTVNGGDSEWVPVSIDYVAPRDFLDEVNKAGIIFPSSDAAIFFGDDMEMAENVCISNVSIFGKEATSIGAFRIGDKYFHFFYWDQAISNFFAKLMSHLCRTVREKAFLNRLSVDISKEVVAALDRITVNNPEREWISDVVVIPVKENELSVLYKKVYDTVELLAERFEEHEQKAKELIEEAEQEEKPVKRKNQKPPNATKQANKIRDMEKKKAAEFAKEAAKLAELKAKSDSDKAKRKQMKKVKKNHQN